MTSKHLHMKRTETSPRNIISTSLNQTSDSRNNRNASRLDWTALREGVLCRAALLFCLLWVWRQTDGLSKTATVAPHKLRWYNLTYGRKRKRTSSLQRHNVHTKLHGCPFSCPTVTCIQKEIRVMTLPKRVMDVISTDDHLPNMSLNNNHGQRYTN